MTRTFLLLAVLATSPAAGQDAADEYYDPAEMEQAREEVKAAHGGGWHSLVLGERLEYQSADGDPAVVWEGQGWLGGDIHKLWFKTEGEHATDPGDVEEAEIQVLYSRAIGRFWELQTGLRHDLEPDPSRSYAVIGLQGLAQYWVELDGSLFLSDEGDVSARLEAEYELRFTQQLILQPRIELNLAFSDDQAIGVGSGLSTADVGLRLRYEFSREFAPYVGLSWIKAYGDTRDWLRSDGEDTNEVSFVVGMRFWF